MRLTCKRRPPPTSRPIEGPMVAYGRPMFGPPDDADGARIAGYRLVRGPDGKLMAVVEPRRRDPS